MTCTVHVSCSAGKYLAGTWQVPGKYLEGTWQVPGKYLASTWQVPGKHLASTWQVSGILQFSLRCPPSYPLAHSSLAGVADFDLGLQVGQMLKERRVPFPCVRDLTMHAVAQLMVHV